MTKSAISLEVFPARTDVQRDALIAALEAFRAIDPTFVSVTYGAGGSTREDSLATVGHVADHGFTSAAHLTIAGSTCAETDRAITAFQGLGVERFVALRGDPPAGETDFLAHPDGYPSSIALVRRLADLGITDISVSFYPERHPDSPSLAAEIDFLAAKVAVGATRAISQFFFETDNYLRYRDRVAARGLDVDLVPGLLPIRTFSQMTRFAERCGASVPNWLHDRFEGTVDNPVAHRRVAEAVLNEQIASLSKAGVSDFHIYTLNDAALPLTVLKQRGMLKEVPTTTPRAAA
ncbi:MAG: methylenetetrahydrofolate reductase [Pseudomonadota bacterium]